MLHSKGDTPLKPSVKIGFVAITLSLMLNACAEKDVATKDDKQIETTPVTEENKKSKDQESTPLKESLIRLPEMKLTYDMEGELHERNAVLHMSEYQGFSLYLYEGYSLEAEEPGKDMIIGENAEIRIEVLPDMTVEERRLLVEERAAATGGDVFHNESALMNGWVNHSIWYKAYTKDMAVSVISALINDKHVVVTIFTPREKEVLQPIIAMLDTMLFQHGVPKADLNESQLKRPETTTLDYMVEGAVESKQAKLYTSESQRLSFYFTEYYEVVPSEYLDVIYMKEDNKTYLEIETIHSESDIEAMIKQTKEEWKHVGELTDHIWKSPGSPFDNMQMVSGGSEKEYIDIMFVKGNDTMPSMKLTFHFPSNFESIGIGHLLAMAETIEKNN